MRHSGIAGVESPEPDYAAPGKTHRARDEDTQWTWEETRGVCRLSPSRSLIEAVIDCAMLDLQKLQRALRRPHGPGAVPLLIGWLPKSQNTAEGLLQDVIGWFEYPGEEPWTFRWCCGHLPQINADGVLRMLRGCEYYPQHYVPMDALVCGKGERKIGKDHLDRTARKCRQCGHTRRHVTWGLCRPCKRKKSQEETC